MYICNFLNNTHPTPTQIKIITYKVIVFWHPSSDPVQLIFWWNFGNKTKLLQWIWFITSLCKTYEEKLQGLLQDALSYLSLSTPVEESKSLQPEAFDRLSDSDALYVHIQTSCKACLEE